VRDAIGRLCFDKVLIANAGITGLGYKDTIYILGSKLDCLKQSSFNSSRSPIASSRAIRRPQG
jgi:hypothetical protein